MPFSWDTARSAAPLDHGPPSEERVAWLTERVTDCDAVLARLRALPVEDPDRMSRALMHKAVALAELGESDAAVDAIREAAALAGATMRQVYDLAESLARDGFIDVAVRVYPLADAQALADIERDRERLRARGLIAAYMSAARYRESSVAAGVLDDLIALGGAASDEIRDRVRGLNLKPALLAPLLLAEIDILIGEERRAEADRALDAFFERFGSDGSPEIQDLLAAVRAEMPRSE